jgi:hypothetical protein
MCYRDRTFCPFHEACSKGKTRNRALTDKAQEASDKFGMGISQFTDKPECFKETKNGQAPKEYTLERPHGVNVRSRP